MDKKQFKALLEYIDMRISLESLRHYHGEEYAERRDACISAALFKAGFDNVKALPKQGKRI